jgi:hypothetical protein
MLANAVAYTQTSDGSRLPEEKQTVLANATTIARCAIRQVYDEMESVLRNYDPKSGFNFIEDRENILFYFHRWFNIKGSHAMLSGDAYRDHIKTFLKNCGNLKWGANEPLEIMDINFTNPDIDPKLMGYVRIHGEKAEEQRGGRIHINFTMISDAHTVATTLVHEMSHKFARTIDISGDSYIGPNNLEGLGSNPVNYGPTILLTNADNYAVFIIQVVQRRAKFKPFVVEQEDNKKKSGGSSSASSSSSSSSSSTTSPG